MELITHTVEDQALAGIALFGTCMYPECLVKFFIGFRMLFWVVLLETRSLSLDKKDTRVDLDINLLWSTANQSKLHWA